MIPLEYLLSILGVLGIFLAGRNIWWAWYITVIVQTFWIVYFFVTHQQSLMIDSMIYFIVFVVNAYYWTKKRNEKVIQDSATLAEQIKKTQESLEQLKKELGEKPND